jgi:catalase
MKFYTKEGHYDLVGNDIPAFFTRDAMKRRPGMVTKEKLERSGEYFSTSTVTKGFRLNCSIFLPYFFVDRK